MAKLTIPECYRKGVFGLATLDLDSTEVIANELGGSTALALEIKSATVIQPLTKNIAKSDLEDMLQALQALYTVRSNSDVPSVEFVEDVLEAIQEHQKRNWDEDELENAKRNFIKLLGIESIRLRSNAKSARTDDERTFCKAKILTEMRPVFTEDIEDGPQGIVVVHRLKLGYHSNRGNGKHEDFYVTLDEEDLEAFKEAIHRAEMKSASLQKHMNKVQLLGA